MIPGISKMVIASPETKANLTCVYRRYSATPIWKGKLKIHETRLTITLVYQRPQCQCS